MTCARDDGRDDTAPYWTALRKYNGAPLLRCVHPILDVGVGAAPLPRSERVYASSPLVLVVSSSYPFISRPPPPSSVRRDDHPLTPPASSRPSSSLSSFFSSRRGHRAIPSGTRDAPPRFLRATRVQRRASGAHRWLLPLTLKGLDATRKARSSRARLARFSLASLFSPSSHPVHSSVLAAEVIACS